MIYDTDDDNEPLSLDLPLDSPLLEMDINKGTTNPQRTSNIYKKVKTQQKLSLLEP